jgi:hypothetical protein
LLIVTDHEHVCKDRFPTISATSPWQRPRRPICNLRKRATLDIGLRLVKAELHLSNLLCSTTDGSMTDGLPSPQPGRERTEAVTLVEARSVVVAGENMQRQFTQAERLQTLPNPLEQRSADPLSAHLG